MLDELLNAMWDKVRPELEAMLEDYIRERMEDTRTLGDIERAICNLREDLGMR